MNLTGCIKGVFKSMGMSYIMLFDWTSEQTTELTKSYIRAEYECEIWLGKKMEKVTI